MSFKFPFFLHHFVPSVAISSWVHLTLEWICISRLLSAEIGFSPPVAVECLTSHLYSRFRVSLQTSEGLHWAGFTSLCFSQHGESRHFMLTTWFYTAEMRSSESPLTLMWFRTTPKPLLHPRVAFPFFLFSKQAEFSLAPQLAALLLTFPSSIQSRVFVLWKERFNKSQRNNVFCFYFSNKLCRKLG